MKQKVRAQDQNLGVKVGAAICEAILDMQPDGVLDVFHRLFVRVPLAIATLKRGARDEIALRVAFDDDGKG